MPAAAGGPAWKRQAASTGQPAGAGSPVRAGVGTGQRPLLQPEGMTEPRTITAKSPADVLALIPYLLGFHPDDSVVLLTLGGDIDNRFHARVDIPRDPADIPEVIGLLADPVRQHGPGRVFVAVYSDDELLAERLSDQLHAALEEAGATVAGAIRADGERWFDLTGCSGPCCPAEGTPYDVSSHPITAQAILDGQVALGSRRELAESLVGTDLTALAAVETAADGYLARALGSARHPLGPPVPGGARAHLLQEGLWVRDRLRRYLADGTPLSDDEVARLLVAVVAIEVRDVAWSEMTRETSRGHVDLWRDVVRRSPFDLLAAPAALLGFAAWLSGDGALAWCAVDRCQEAEPDYRLASLLVSALAGAVSPTTWEPIPPEDLPLFAS